MIRKTQREEGPRYDKVGRRQRPNRIVEMPHVRYRMA